MTDPPLSDRVARLSEPQKEVLRLVRQAKKSEQIAAELRISKSAVDKRIEAAMRHLRVTRREVAAMLLEQAEEGLVQRTAEMDTAAAEGWVPGTAETDPVAAENRAPGTAETDAVAVEDCVPLAAELYTVAFSADPEPMPSHDAEPEGHPAQASERLVGLSVRQRIDLFFAVILLSLLVFGFATIASQLLQGAIRVAPAAPPSTD